MINFIKSLILFSILVFSVSEAFGQTATQISYIQWISPGECGKMKEQAQSLVLEQRASFLDFYGSPVTVARSQSIKSAVSMLCASSNVLLPPSPLTNAEFKKFMLKKQQRGVLQVGEGTLECDGAGTILSYSPGKIYDHPGFTPIAVRSPLGQMTMAYEKAELGKLDDTLEKTASCVTRTVTARSRVSKLPGGYVSKMILLNFPPWISRTIRYKQCCHERNTIQFSGSHFPSHHGYEGSALEAASVQSGFVEFLKTPGGTDARVQNLNAK